MKKEKKCLLFLVICCLLCGCSQENAKQDNSSQQTSNYFFPPQITSQEYTAIFSGFLGQPEQKSMTVSVNEIQHYKDGTLYELKMEGSEEELNRYAEYREKWWHIGFFLVKEDEIYLIPSEKISNKFQSAEELQKEGTLVCNEAGKGLIRYWSGYGARAQDIELFLRGEESVR